MRVWRVIASAGICVTLTGCAGFPGFATKVSIPYFASLTPDELCGGFNKNCQPSNSYSYVKLKEPVDYRDPPGFILGRKFKSIYQTSPCAPVPTFKGRYADDDEVDYFGQAGIQGKLKRNSKLVVNAKISADVDSFVEQTFPEFPAEFKAGVKSELKKEISTSLSSSADITYHRMTLSQAYTDTKLRACLEQTPKNENVITGVSVITVSGNWASERIKDSLADVEASAAYNNLSAELKATYTSKKTVALDGHFEPLPFVFIVGVRPGEKMEGQH